MTDIAATQMQYGTSLDGVCSIQSRAKCHRQQLTKNGTKSGAHTDRIHSSLVWGGCRIADLRVKIVLEKPPNTWPTL